MDVAEEEVAAINVALIRDALHRAEVQEKIEKLMMSEGKAGVAGDDGGDEAEDGSADGGGDEGEDEDDGAVADVVLCGANDALCRKLLRW